MRPDTGPEGGQLQTTDLRINAADFGDSDDNDEDSSVQVAGNPDDA
jgi:hypothetical protein